MSKGLEALKDLSKMVFIYGGVEQYKTIEEELKEYESYKGFLDNVEKGAVTYTPRDIWEEERKKLKVLEIIKNHIGVIKGYLYTTDSQITDSEYELLCEVLR